MKSKPPSVPPPSSAPKRPFRVNWSTATTEHNAEESKNTEDVQAPSLTVRETPRTVHETPPLQTQSENGAATAEERKSSYSLLSERKSFKAATPRSTSGGREYFNLIGSSFSARPQTPTMSVKSVTPSPRPFPQATSFTGSIVANLQKEYEQLQRQLELGPQTWDEGDDVFVLREKINILLGTLDEEKERYKRLQEERDGLEAENLSLMHDNMQVTGELNMGKEEAAKMLEQMTKDEDELKALRQIKSSLAERMKRVETSKWNTDTISFERTINIDELKKKNAEMAEKLGKELRERERSLAAMVKQYRKIRQLTKETAALKQKATHEAELRNAAEKSAHANQQLLMPLQEKNLILSYRLSNREYELNKAQTTVAERENQLREIKAKNLLLLRDMDRSRGARLKAQDDQGYAEVKLHELGERTSDLIERLEDELEETRRLTGISNELQGEVRSLRETNDSLKEAVDIRDRTIHRIDEQMRAKDGQIQRLEERINELHQKLQSQGAQCGDAVSAQKRTERELEELKERITKLMTKYKRCALCALGIGERHRHHRQYDAASIPESARSSLRTFSEFDFASEADTLRHNDEQDLVVQSSLDTEDPQFTQQHQPPSEKAYYVKQQSRDILSQAVYENDVKNHGTARGESETTTSSPTISESPKGSMSLRSSLRRGLVIKTATADVNNLHRDIDLRSPSVRFKEDGLLATVREDIDAVRSNLSSIASSNEYSSLSNATPRASSAADIYHSTTTKRKADNNTTKQQQHQRPSSEGDIVVPRDASRDASSSNNTIALQIHPATPSRSTRVVPPLKLSRGGVGEKVHQQQQQQQQQQQHQQQRSEVSILPSRETYTPTFEEDDFSSSSVRSFAERSLSQFSFRSWKSRAASAMSGVAIDEPIPSPSSTVFSHTELSARRVAEASGAEMPPSEIVAQRHWDFIKGLEDARTDAKRAIATSRSARLSKEKVPLPA